MELIKHIDEVILIFIKDNLSNNFFNIIMPIISALGNIGFIWILSAIVMISMKKYRNYGFAVITALAIGYLIGNIILKNIFARIRPYNMIEGIELLIAPLSDFSFPSGHTLSSFAAAMIIFAANKRWGIPAFILASLIAFSRMYLFVHYPTDIIAGILIGLFSAYITLLIFKKFGWIKNTQKNHNINKKLNNQNKI